MTHPRSIYDEVGGMVYFPRLLDKIRLHARGELAEDYHGNLGHGADGWCLGFLRVSYDDLKAEVAKGGTDEEILEWCYAHGRRLDEGDLRIWNGYVTKVGWNDFATDFLVKTKAKYGLAERDDIQTVPQLIDADEGRGPRPSPGSPAAS